jgi:hypothetical protein
MNRSLSEVIFQHGMGANSIPVNIWFWLTLHSIGWSETILRFPSIVAGIASLVVLPYLVRKLWGDLISLIFTALLAVSPIAIFYARVDRPFSPALLFGTASVLLTMLWIQEGQRRNLLTSVICGFFAVYYHLYSVIPVVMALLVALLASFKPVSKHVGLSVHKQLPWHDIGLAATILTLLLGVFVGVPNIMDPWWKGYQGMSHANINTLFTFMEFIAGTARLNLYLLMFILIPAGCILLIKRSRTIGLAFLAPLLTFITVIANYTQDGAHAGIQAARYGIVIFPLSFIAIAITVDWCVKRFEAVIPAPAARLAMPVLWLPFIATSPLWTIFSYPNNFTNHSGYQYHYAPISWERSPERDLAPGISVSRNEIPSVYRSPEFLKKYKGIIEYPVAIGDHLNLLFYYQHFHKLPIVAGYTKHDPSERYPLRGEWVFADRMIDYVMTGVPTTLANNTSTWNTLIDIEDIQRLKKQYGGWLLILHRSPVREVTGHIAETGEIRSNILDLPLTDIATAFLNKNLGAPTQINNHLVVWSIQ